MSITEPRELISVLSQMEYWRQEPSDEEQRRAFRRFTVRGDATLEPADGGTVNLNPLPVMLRDISRGGIGFVLEQFIEPGSVWRINLYDHGRKAGSQTLVVRYCRLVQDGLYLVGAQFIVEPYLMLLLGVPEADLADDIRDRNTEQDTANFVAPDEVES